MIDADRPLLIFGGPYSNLQAMEALQSIADMRGVPAGNVICTGDVVAYGAEPEATANLVREWGIPVVAGNCEQQLAAGAADCGCGFETGSACELLSGGWYAYALSHLTETTRAWMGTCPSSLSFTYHGLRVHALHGGRTQTNRFLFASQTDALAAEAAPIGADVILAGHAGLPFVASLEDRIWLNAGVIGMPANDGTPDGWYALVEPEERDLRLSLHRLRFDHVTAARRMRRAGHANGYARTLITGIWPSLDVLPPIERAQTGQPLQPVSISIRKPSVIPA